MSEIEEVVGRVKRIENLVNEIHTCLVGDLQKAGMVERLVAVERVIKKTTWTIGIVFVALVSSLIKDFTGNKVDIPPEKIIEMHQNIDKLSN